MFCAEEVVFRYLCNDVHSGSMSAARFVSEVPLGVSINRSTLSNPRNSKAASYSISTSDDFSKRSVIVGSATSVRRSAPHSEFKAE